MKSVIRQNHSLMEKNSYPCLETCPRGAAHPVHTPSPLLPTSIAEPDPYFFCTTAESKFSWQSIRHRRARKGKFMPHRMKPYHPLSITGPQKEIRDVGSQHSCAFLGLLATGDSGAPWLCLHIPTATRESNPQICPTIQEYMGKKKKKAFFFSAFSLLLFCWLFVFLFPGFDCKPFCLWAPGNSPT